MGCMQSISGSWFLEKLFGSRPSLRSQSSESQNRKCPALIFPSVEGVPTALGSWLPRGVWRWHQMSNRGLELPYLFPPGPATFPWRTMELTAVVLLLKSIFRVNLLFCDLLLGFLNEPLLGLDTPQRLTALPCHSRNLAFKGRSRWPLAAKLFCVNLSALAGRRLGNGIAIEALVRAQANFIASQAIKSCINRSKCQRSRC